MLLFLQSVILFAKNWYCKTIVQRAIVTGRKGEAVLNKVFLWEALLRGANPYPFVCH